ncbi:hypothetical protein [Paucihalobacter sp.]|uniref:hypothetical protein n=1 Tax=Paucihalobacter sp. TaxID=2850405 RepID=UPI002FE16B19
MVLNDIEKLLEKYDLGETTLQEEQALRTYFSENEAPEHLKSYGLMFQYFEQTKQEHATKEVPLKPKKSNVYKWISVAAAAVLMFGLYISQPEPVKTELSQLSQEEQELYYKTIEALDLVSNQLNKGKQQLVVLDVMASSYNEGIEKVSMLDEFSQTTNKIFKTETN